MTIQIAILVGIILNVYLAWRIKKDIDELESVVGQMLFDLGEQGILNVEVENDDS